MTTQPLVIAQAQGGDWALWNGDCVEVCRGIPDASVSYTIFSPPFASLYTYSDDPRDMSNNQSDSVFWAHFAFLIADLYRIIMPGRLASIHCMNLPTSKLRDGYIGIRDFRGDIIRAFQSAGFIYHSETCIRKDPVSAMQRTKSIGLLHKQMVKDSCMSRMAIADYIVTMRKPGVNPEPISGLLDDELLADKIPPNFIAWDGSTKQHSPETRSIAVWQRYAEPIWMDIAQSDVLSRKLARDEADEAHISPLQLTAIRRCIDLWTNPGDVVFSPFAGIGSELYCAVEMGRRAIGAELKPSYYRQAVNNLSTLAAVTQHEAFVPTTPPEPKPAQRVVRPAKPPRWCQPDDPQSVADELQVLALHADISGEPVTFSAQQAHDVHRLLAERLDFAEERAQLEREVREAEEGADLCIAENLKLEEDLAAAKRRIAELEKTT